MRGSRAATMVLAAWLLALLPLGTTTTRANTVDIVHDGFGAHDALTFWGGGREGDLGMAGVYMLDKTGDTGIGNLWSNGAIPGFCIDLVEPPPETTTTYMVDTPDNTYNYTLGEVLGNEKANYLRELWAEHYDPVWASGGWYTPEQIGRAEAFAAAIWEIIYEELPTTSLGWDVTVDGSLGAAGFAANGLDAATANKWLHDLTGGGAKADLMVFHHNGGQDYLVAVPEPATIALLALGGVVLVRRRRS